ncbi:hypothetical protein RB195_002020 [Necator americanus]|uniref:Reverse transcriptase domain-containing protein n=1 Tax=Necator americanus TaxID=51031 RepID=A0ABR1DH01_NECAM
MEFEKAWEDKNSHKAYALLKQYSGKMKRYSPVLNTAKTLLNRQAPSTPELEHVHRPTYAVNEKSPTVSEVLVCIKKMRNGKCGGDDEISAEKLKYLPPPGIRERTKIIRSIWIDERIPESWRYAIVVPSTLSVTDPSNYQGISLLRAMYKVLEWIIPDRLIKNHEEITRDEQAGFRPDRSTTGQLSPPRPSDVQHRLRWWSKTRDSGRTLPVQFRHDENMRATVDQWPVDIVPAPSGRPFEYADDVVIFAESSMKLQHVVLVSKLAAA